MVLILGIVNPRHPRLGKSEQSRGRPVSVFVTDCLQVPIYKANIT